MREYEFRGKAKNGTWFYGDLEHIEGYVYVHSMRVDPDTVGQYTGLKGKNGVKIFEGDIVEWKQKSTRGIIEFADAAYFIGEELLLENLFGIEVIGNIHDNPELLEAQ